jgi:hypothetical protein
MAVVVVAPRARTQIRRTVEYWERDHPGKRSRLADELRASLREVTRILHRSQLMVSCTAASSWIAPGGRNERLRPLNEPILDSAVQQCISWRLPAL